MNDKQTNKLTADETDATLLTELQLAERHQRSVKTLRNERLRGAGVPFVKIGRHVRYRVVDILAFEASHRRLSTSDTGGVK